MSTDIKQFKFNSPTIKWGDTVYGHVCLYCISSVDKGFASKENPWITADCRACGHRAEGISTTAKIMDWGIFGKSSAAAEIGRAMP